MLLSATRLCTTFLVASDGDPGTIEDIYFDDQAWVARYLVADTGGWLNGRRVLISPRSVDKINLQDNTVHVALTRQQVESSPGIDIAKPVSRQHERDVYDHCGFSFGPSGSSGPEATVYPGVVEKYPDDPAASAHDVQDMAKADPHLRSWTEVAGYGIRATDDNIGHVEDFLISEDDWSIRLIVVDPSNWWPGKHVLVSPERVTEVSWAERRVAVNLTRAAIEDGPEFDPSDLSMPLGQQKGDGGATRARSRS
jgi:hypothetical protein